ncbi:MAG: amidohydrolase family protein [Candidatus Aminicenantaceae bacterium]
MQLAIDFSGADHLVAGSDYPHQIGSLTKMINSIKELDISDQDKAAISSGNATRLLGL